jgi:hypothetical protein
MVKLGDLLALAKANPLLAAGAAGAVVAAGVVLLPLALLAVTLLLPVLLPAGILGLVSRGLLCNGCTVAAGLQQNGSQSRQCMCLLCRLEWHCLSACGPNMPGPQLQVRASDAASVVRILPRNARPLATAGQAERALPAFRHGMAGI